MITINGLHFNFTENLTLLDAINRFIQTEKGAIFKIEPYFAVLNDKFISQDHLNTTLLTEGSVITVYHLAEGG